MGGFTAADVVGVIGSASAFAFLLLRRQMLRSRFKAWHSAGWPVQAALAVLAVYMGMVALSILCGSHASQREAWSYMILAGVSLVMLANLDQLGRRDPSADD